jgi:protein O-GlcNAc transferase
MLTPDDSRKLQRALLLHQRGDLKGAAKLYRQLITADPNNSYAFHYLGVLEVALGNTEQAKLFMARSLSKQPNNIKFIENYAAILFQSQDYHSALHVCQQGLTLKETNPSLLYIGAISLLKLNQLQESLRNFDSLLSLMPNHTVAHNERGLS